MSAMLITGLESVAGYFGEVIKQSNRAMKMERRQGERQTAAYDAEVRYQSGRKLTLPVLDISVGGCMVDARAWSIRPGERVSVKLPTLNWQPAKLVWNEDGRAGIAFEEPLYEPTLEHLSRLAA